MIYNLGRALRHTAGGSVIFVLGVGAVGSQPPVVVATSAASTLAISSSIPSATTSSGRAVDERTPPHDERAAGLALKAALKQARPVAASKPAVRPSTRARRVTIAATPRPAAPAAPVFAAAGNSAGYAYGYCTWWVSHKRLIPWHGMAYQWWSLARAYGFAEGSTPRVGAVMVMGAGMAGASASSGHVAYVESVNANGSFLISEMNWYGSGGGWGKVDYRTITSMSGILGFIY